MNLEVFEVAQSNDTVRLALEKGGYTEDGVALVVVDANGDIEEVIADITSEGLTLIGGVGSFPTTGPGAYIKTQKN